MNTLLFLLYICLPFRLLHISLFGIYINVFPNFIIYIKCISARKWEFNKSSSKNYCSNVFPSKMNYNSFEISSDKIILSGYELNLSYVKNVCYL